MSRWYTVLAAALRESGRPCVRLGPTCAGDERQTDGPVASLGDNSAIVVIADGPRWRAHLRAERWDLTIWVRSARTGWRGDGADDGVDVVVDLHDLSWPVIRHVDPGLAPAESWFRSETVAFFAPRAATWDTRFGDDLPAYTAAVASAGLVRGGVVIDVGCGTGRALPALRDAVGPEGTVIGVDMTPEMLVAARPRALGNRASLVRADVRHLPFESATADGLFAAGLLSHLPDTDAGLRELARVTRPGGKLVLFHPSGRAALAARHGRTLRPDEPLAETSLRAAAGRTGWCLDRYDDPDHRFLAVASRAS